MIIRRQSSNTKRFTSFTQAKRTQTKNTLAKRILPLAISAISLSPAVQADDDGMWDMSLEDLANTRVTSIATGTATPLDKAAAVATIITEKDILAIGATDLDEVLETVPGLHVARSSQAFPPKYNIRGITSQYNSQTLMLVNGIPVTDLVFGNRNNVWGGMPTKSIKRIEIIRGPGSAMFGADAFAGVINIITKGRKDINGSVVGSRAGSFDTQAFWLEHGDNYKGLDIGFTLEYETTDGWEEIVKSDAQTAFDDDFSTTASLAPGSVNAMTNMIEARLDIQYENSRFRLGYQGRNNVGTGPGLAQALDPNGRFSSNRLNLDYTYTLKDLSPNWGLDTRISYFRNTQEPEENVWVFPPGAFGGAYPQGFIGNPGYKIHSARFDFNSEYRGLRKHLIRLGTGTYWGDVFETTETKNFNPDFSPRGDLVDVSDTAEVWLPEEDRNTYHFFIQDEWQLLDNWQLTSGIRYDHYSDFGSTTNPRLALVWTATDSITTKLLYGRAFRAPSIAELYVTSNPISLGDKNLKPEKIDTYEFALTQQVSSSIAYSSNLYYYKIKDFISFEDIGGNAKQAQNYGKRTGYGFEIEASLKARDNLKLLANYSFQQSEDDKEDTHVGLAPTNQVYIRTEWKTNVKWLISPQLTWIGKQKRSHSDNRSKPVSSRVTVDLTIRQQEVIKDLDVTFSIRNLTDKSIYEPSPAGGLPNDFPMAGRNIYGEINYTF